MFEIPGLDVKVGFGRPDKVISEWDGDVDLDEDESAEDKPLSPAERRAIVGVLGFDPAELDDDESADDEPEE